MLCYVVLICSVTGLDKVFNKEDKTSQLNLFYFD